MWVARAGSPVVGSSLTNVDSAESAAKLSALRTGVSTWDTSVTEAMMSYSCTLWWKAGQPSKVVVGSISPVRIAAQACVRRMGQLSISVPGGRNK
jgi:hypothetical protein